MFSHSQSWSSLRRRRVLILFALPTTFAGVALIIDRPKGTVLEWLALPLVVIGGSVFAWAVWPISAPTRDESHSLASRLLLRVTLNARLVPFFPAIGLSMILADIAYNTSLSATPALQTEDTIVLLSGISLIAYNLVPKRFVRERDFVLMFFLTLSAILVLPLLVARAYYADFERSVDLYSWVALAPQTSALLNVLGVSNTLHAVAGSTAPGLTFRPANLSSDVTVVITTACSGIYSFGIFAAAFTAFVLTEYQTLNRRFLVLFGLGFVTAYVANVLRMTAIVLVGYYTDSEQTDLQNMLIAHSYAGWLLFLGWITLFWGVLFKLLPWSRGADREEHAVPVKTGSRCGICKNHLTPILPATRCACGAYYHRRCLGSAGECPVCGQVARPETHS